MNRSSPFPVLRALLISVGLFVRFAGAVERDDPTTVIVDASAFFDTLPKGDTIVDAAMLGLPWVFNNDALVCKSTEPAVARMNITEAGRYRLFVRSQGNPGSSFRVQVNGRLDSAAFGTGGMAWVKGDTFELAAGPVEIRLAPDTPMSTLDVLVLSKKDDLAEADLVPLQLPADVQLLKDFAIPNASAVKFGDVTGDGKMDILVLAPDFSATVFDHEGKLLWTYQAPTEGVLDRSSFEAPGSIWDFDGDGFAEVVHWRMIEGSEWLVMADGRTGAIRHRSAWPTTPPPHVYNNFRTAIAKFGPGRADTLLVLTDSGGTISVSAYTAELQPLWTHTEHKLKDHLGHYLYPIDLNGDGIDEVAVSAMVLDAKGQVLWQRYDLFADNHQHVDSYRFADLDGDGKLELLASLSDEGTVIFRSDTGAIFWRQPADHTQQIEFGSFLKNTPGPQVVVTARTYGRPELREPYLSGQIYWFDPTGKLLSKWPRNPLNGNPDFVKGDWRGDGHDELFWFKFHLEASGQGTLYFADPVYHMFDFMGNGAEQVITQRGRSLKVYGWRNAAQRPVTRDSEYLRNQVVNHTHY